VERRRIHAAAISALPLVKSQEVGTAEVREMETRDVGSAQFTHIGKGKLRNIQSLTLIFFKIPFYLQSVLVHSENCVTCNM
jgi:hypothetical protein